MDFTFFLLRTVPRLVFIFCTELLLLFRILRTSDYLAIQVDPSSRV